MCNEMEDRVGITAADGLCTRTMSFQSGIYNQEAEAEWQAHITSSKHKEHLKTSSGSSYLD